MKYMSGMFARAIEVKTHPLVMGEKSKQRGAPRGLVPLQTDYIPR